MAYHIYKEDGTLYRSYMDKHDWVAARDLKVNPGYTLKYQPITYKMIGIATEFAATPGQVREICSYTSREAAEKGCDQYRHNQDKYAPLWFFYIKEVQAEEV